MHRRGPQFFVAHGHHGHPFLWLLILVVLAVVFVAAVYALLRARRASPGGPPGGTMHPADPALESLRLRYARGEIDRDEFARVSADLGAPPPPAAA